VTLRVGGKTYHGKLHGGRVRFDLPTFHRADTFKATIKYLGGDKVGAAEKILHLVVKPRR
jgi:hypothetical protein